MDQSDQQQQPSTSASIQVMPSTMFGNGQQVFLQSLQQQLNANGQQSLQLVPIMQGGQGTSYILQQQAPQPQILQLPDGQTFIYQQPISDQQQPQIININGNYYQLPAQQAISNPQIQTQVATSPTSAQQVLIPSILPEAQVQQTAVNETASPPLEQSASSTPPVESEEEPLYVNASKSQTL